VGCSLKVAQWNSERKSPSFDTLYISYSAFSLHEMGFCRRCGDIVAGARCHCGGSPVAPVITFKNSEYSSNTESQDRWTKTYVCPPGSANPVLEKSTSNPRSKQLSTGPASSSESASTTRRFPRPISFSSAPLKPLQNVSDHITQATSQSPRPPSPLKMSTTISDLENDIIPSFLPHEPTLSKVYGSVLQPKDALTMHSCGLCSTIFPPDATIYPNPLNSTSFLCKPCFSVSGGSKGLCPSCSRPVLTLKAEGGFVHSGGKYWHKRCYNCTGCFKNIGDAPMVDLLGRPSCVECFDNCLKRDPTTPKRDKATSNNSPNISSPRGLNTSYGRKRSRESSPAIEELEMRLGLTKSREGSPVIETNRSMSARLDTSLNRSLLDTDSPKSKRSDISPGKSTLDSRVTRTPSTLPLSRSFDLSYSIDSGIGKCTGLTSSKTSPYTIVSSGSDAIPPTESQMVKESNNSAGSLSAVAVPKSPGMTVTVTSVCGKCSRPVLNPREGGQFVTIPGADENDAPHMYHTECFRCAVCEKPFNDAKKGQVSFIKSDAGPCHTQVVSLPTYIFTTLTLPLQCAPTEQFVIRKPISTKSLYQPTFIGPPKSSPNHFSSKQSSNSMISPIRTQEPTYISHSPVKPAFPRFGGQNVCPGCQKPVSVMEFGVVPGPQGTRWHASCLVCGGKKEVTRAVLLGRVRESKRLGEPGCGKKLDSAAKSDGDGGIWCRECLLLLGVGGSPQGSPIRSPLAPPCTGNSTKFTPLETPIKVSPQYTGTTTIARQFTGVGGSDAILRQLTGGGLSPTRSISPTKQLGMMGVGMVRPRPKSVIGMRNTKSVDEGRGMYLVRQLTGASGGGL
ncbi:hypothetical protein CVT25_002208, partial [Psilocybe cyanescens]